MVSTLGTRPNHYDVLGLVPTASEAEIAGAFAEAMSALNPRAFGGLADVSIAYETLRDPARRRDYDAAIGLASAPPAPPAAQPEWKPFLMRATAKPAERPRAEPQPREEAAAPFVAASPGQPGNRDPRLDMFAAVAAPAPLRPPSPQPAPSPRAPAADEQLPRTAEEAALPEIADGSVDWVRPVAIGGGLVAAVALAGAWAGWAASNGAPPEQAEAAVTLALPHLGPEPATRVAAPQPPATGVPDVSPIARKAPATVPSPTRQVQPAAAPRAPAAGRHPLAQISPNRAGDRAALSAAETEAADAPPAQPAAAAMPLPDRVIARTIGRIGYPCGSVASTSAVEGGAPGVFKVTCASGHSYRASPVRGRYHFRRWTGG
jgi:hypothetical protein